MDTLISRGVTTCFAVTGGGAMYLDNALFKCKTMNKMFNHHEQACAMAAEGYYKASGKMALVCVTSGPGGTNTLTGVMGAWVDSIPMIVISGQVRYEISVPKSGLKLRYRGTQEFDIIDTVKTMTKYAKIVINPLDIKMEINKAVDIALSGRRGPVWLDIPMDVQSSIVETDDLTTCFNFKKEYSITRNCVEDVLQIIKEAKRPVILAGRGVSTSNAINSFRKMVDILNVPVLTSSSGAGILYHDNKNYFGSSGSFGPRAGNFIIQNADFILTLGCSLSFSSTGFAQQYFAPNATIYSVDVEPDELKKPGLHINKAIICDVHQFIDQVIQISSRIDVSKKWLEYCELVKNRFSPFEAAFTKKNNERVCSYVFWSKYYKHARKDTITVLGNNTAIIGGLQAGTYKEEQMIIGNKNCGSMGYDIPAAIGAAVGSNREVILVTGDGSFMMNLQELQTIKHYGLSIKIVVFENNGYNAIRQTHKNFFNGELIGCTPETGVSFPSFEKVADTFGFAYQKCETNGQIDDALSNFFSIKDNVILEISELLDDPIVPKVMSRPLPDGTLATPALQDMAPFIDKEEYDELMKISKE